MNQEYQVYYDQRVIRIVQNNRKVSDGETRHLDDQFSWDVFTSFINSAGRSLTFLSENPDALFRHFATYFHCVDAAGGLVVNPAGQWLFLVRNGRWDLPKGMVEPHENNEQAAIREVEEECGVNGVEIIRQLPHTYHVYPDRDQRWMLKKTHWFMMHYKGSKAPEVQFDEGISHYDWRKPDQIDDIAENTYGNIRALIRYCRENLRPGLSHPE